MDRRSLPARAEHVGSLLRPRALTEGYRRFARGVIGTDAFRAIQDEAIRNVVALQESVGLAVVTDGELRRASYWAHWVDALEGLDVAPAVFTFHDSEGNEQEFLAADCRGKLAKTREISTGELRFLRTVTSRTPKVTMPSPSTLHFWRLQQTIEGSGYADDQSYLDDLCAIYRRELEDLAEVGCRYVQLDEVPLIMLASPAVRDQVRARGADPEKLTNLYVEALNSVLRQRPPEMTATMHLCRGNFRGRWLSEGSYEAIAEKVFGSVAVDGFFLEFDTERAGGFEPLRFVPRGKRVVLGLVSTKSPELEEDEALKQRVEEAARFAPLSDLCLSPQCGFASTVAGNPVTEEDEKQKLEQIVRVAGDLWGDEA
jgi:5-methyltetrahydropteroyltriglutamate--homocysteine methyltransferase